MKQRASTSWLLIPLTIYMAVLGILFVERTGVTYQVHQPSSHFLTSADKPLPSRYTEPAAEALVLFDSSNPFEDDLVGIITETLDDMRVRYAVVDVMNLSTLPLENYQTVVIAFTEMEHMPRIHQLVEWVEQGGRALFAAPPSVTAEYASIYRKLGVESFADDQIETLGVIFTSDLLPGSKGMVLEGTEDFLENASYTVRLDDQARVHMTSADDYKLPLLWERDYGQGRFVVINTDQFNTTDTKGIVGAAYSLLPDAFAYPVINSSVFFIDDFPAPIPQGDDPVITEEFQRDIRSFLLHVWWPDMEEIADKYGLVYTGLIVQTYNFTIEPPFEENHFADDHRYLGSLLLRRGGEIGLHGYNHVPFCQAKDGINQKFQYPTWTSLENVQTVVRMLDAFSRALFADQAFATYVPPSNILCAEARELLPKILPDLKVISALYIEDEREGAYFQEFEEAADGIIEFPRIVSGYFLYEEGQLARVSELGLHYVNSHFLHPDDILDPIRRENRTWATMRMQFDTQTKWLAENAPGLRNMTVSEGAMAVQRYDRLKVSAALEGDRYTIRLDDFYDEASLMLRTALEPVEISGGTITKVTSSLYLIQADEPEITVRVRGQE